MQWNKTLNFWLPVLLARCCSATRRDINDTDDINHQLRKKHSTQVSFWKRFKREEFHRWVEIKFYTTVNWFRVSGEGIVCVFCVISGFLWSIFPPHLSCVCLISPACQLSPPVCCHLHTWTSSSCLQCFCSSLSVSGVSPPHSTFTSSPRSFVPRSCGAVSLHVFACSCFRPFSQQTLWFKPWPSPNELTWLEYSRH